MPISSPIGVKRDEASSAKGPWTVSSLTTRRRKPVLMYNLQTKGIQLHGSDYVETEGLTITWSHFE